MTEINKKLLAKIGKIQAEIKDLVRDESNKFQNYKYFEESQILKILKPLLSREKLTLKISDDDTQPLQWDKEGNKHYLRYLKKMEVCDQDSGATETFKFWACGDNVNFAQAKGAGETYAMKYMLSKFFLIRVIDENDPDLKEEKQENEQVLNNKEKPKSKIITDSTELKERQIIREKVVLRKDERGEAWLFCKRCDVEHPQEPFKLIKHHSEIKTSEIIKALENHGELEKGNNNYVRN